MRNLPKMSSKALWESLIATSCLLLAAGAIPAVSDDSYLSKAPQSWSEEEALRVLNDSPWAKTVKPSTQDSACGYKNPAIPGELDDDEAVKLEIRVPTGPSLQVKPDGAEYLIRWQSAKPMQAAVQRLLALGDQWKEYRGEEHRAHVPGWENYGFLTTDMIGISIILKQKGPEGESFLDYFFDLPKKVLARGLNLWPCACLKTEAGVTCARALGHGHMVLENPAITMFFSNSVHGKLLITKPGEEVEFRFVAKQRVFEATFLINTGDLVPDMSEPVLYYPTAWTDLKAIKEEASVQ